jgi:hypothetical protein
LDGHSVNREPDPEIGDLLNALVDLRRQLVLPVLHVLPRTARRIECHFPLSAAKADFAGRTRQ